MEGIILVVRKANETLGGSVEEYPGVSMGVSLEVKNSMAVGIKEIKRRFKSASKERKQQVIYTRICIELKSTIIQVVTRQADPEETHTTHCGETRQAGAADLDVWAQLAHVILVVALKQRDNEKSFSFLSCSKISCRQTGRTRKTPGFFGRWGQTTMSLPHDTCAQKRSIAERPSRSCQGSLRERGRILTKVWLEICTLMKGPSGLRQPDYEVIFEGKISNRLDSVDGS
jgi:hypothetical protein